MIASSNLRWPRVCSSRIANATTAVIRPATNGGTPKSRFSAIAAPTNSARSVAIAIASACSQSPNVTGFLKCSRQSSGQVLAGRDAGLRAQVLDEHRHQVRGDDHPHEHVAVLGAARDVGGEVAGVDVGDGGDEGGAEQRERALDAAAVADRAAAATRVRRRRAGRRRGRPRPAWAGSRRAHPHRGGEPAAERVRLAADVDEQRAAERLLVDDRQLGARARSRARRGSGASRARRR